MRPLTAEHLGFKLRVRAHQVGRAWSALVEVWTPGSPDGAEAQIVPFNATLQTEKLAQSAGRDVALRFIDREAKRG